MTIKARILPFNKRAADGSIFSREVIAKYLESAQYEFRMNTRTCLGGITHINRDKDKSPSEIIAVVDQFLLNKAITHVVTEMYIEGDWLCGTIELFDENLFAGTEVATNIKFIKGLLQSGVNLPVSAAVFGKWNNNICVELLDISGVDFTLDPGFEGAGVILPGRNISSISTRPYSKRR